MRLIVLVVAALLTLPAIGSIGPQARPAQKDDPLADVPDGELIRLLALHEGIQARHEPPALVPPGATVASLGAKLASRVGIPETPADFAGFATLDPRVAGPLLAGLAGVDRAWDLRDLAFAKLTRAQQVRLEDLALAHQFDSEEYAQLDAQVDKAALIDSAIVLADTLEGIVIPELKAAIDAGAWPTTPLADPGVQGIGILRLGGAAGGETETVDRVLQMDPHGGDTYLNNAGGTTFYKYLNALGTQLTPGILVSASVHFEGHDVFRAQNLYTTTCCPSQGGALAGPAMLLDLGGESSYSCGQYCQGGSGQGPAVLRIYQGNASFVVGPFSAGGAAGPSLSPVAGNIGILRHDRGMTTLDTDSESAGWAGAPGAIGLLWLGTGEKSYKMRFDNYDLLGYSAAGGDGWLLDEGSGPAVFVDGEGAPFNIRCQDCIMRNGAPSPIDGTVHGIFSDNSGGLGELLQIGYLN
ncbi:MAG: hypothetical protein QOE90_3525 [Thermoplasmata archaeon]|jgi:hypothetical protein|nr:hypothetical protein [Thermoplasmata archaeon]